MNFAAFGMRDAGMTGNFALDTSNLGDADKAARCADDEAFWYEVALGKHPLGSLLHRSTQGSGIVLFDYLGEKWLAHPSDPIEGQRGRHIRCRIFPAISLEPRVGNAMIAQVLRVLWSSPTIQHWHSNSEEFYAGSNSEAWTAICLQESRLRAPVIVRTVPAQSDPLWCVDQAVERVEAKLNGTFLSSWDDVLWYSLKPGSEEPPPDGSLAIKDVLEAHITARVLKKIGLDDTELWSLVDRHGGGHERIALGPQRPQKPSWERSATVLRAALTYLEKTEGNCNANGSRTGT